MEEDTKSIIWIIDANTKEESKRAWCKLLENIKEWKKLIYLLCEILAYTKEDTKSAYIESFFV